MIKTALSKHLIEAALLNLDLGDKQPLRDYAGFDVDSKYAGLSRQSFSLVLTSDAIHAIRQSISALYDQLIRDCWPKGELLPFDVVRFDAFLHPHDNSLRIMELNTRNVGLHEIVEWLDDLTVASIHGVATESLNRLIVNNQRLLQVSKTGWDEPLLYMTDPGTPDWIYQEKLRNAYGQLHRVGAASEYEVTSTGLMAGKQSFRAITRKFAWKLTEKEIELNNKGIISIMQPRWMSDFGKKSYLTHFTGNSTLHTEQFHAAEVTKYLESKDTLVLKIIDAGGSRSVYLGTAMSAEEWEEHIAKAAVKPTRWVLQEYQSPFKHQIIAHQKEVLDLPIQLGIFVLPDPRSPQNFKLDIAAKAFAGTDKYFTFDPSGLNPDIWFGNVIESTAS